MMRFIRKNGRVIPIGDWKQTALSGYKKQAMIGSASAALLKGVEHSIVRGHTKAAMGFAAAGVLSTVGGISHNVITARKVADQSKGKRGGVGQFFRNYGSAWLGGAATTLLISSPIRAGMLARKIRDIN